MHTFICFFFWQHYPNIEMQILQTQNKLISVQKFVWFTLIMVIWWLCMMDDENDPDVDGDVVDDIHLWSLHQDTSGAGIIVYNSSTKAYMRTCANMWYGDNVDPRRSERHKRGWFCRDANLVFQVMAKLKMVKEIFQR